MNETVTAVASAMCPWLALLLGVQRLVGWRWRTVRGLPMLIVPGAIALGILSVPIDRIAVARWVASVSASFSMPLAGLLAIAAWERAFARPLFSRRDWDAAWAFGAIGGLALYPPALGVGSIDPYAWGWSSSPLFAAAGALTAWLISTRNRFGILLLAAVVAYQLRLGESTNYWDYLIDPIYWLTSLVVLGKKVLLQRGPLSRRGARIRVRAASP
jgi:hypothetical protein